MRRDRLDPFLDKLFAKHLSDHGFLQQVARAKRQPKSNIDQVKRQLDALTAKRERILDAYYEGATSEAERNKALAEVEREKQIFSDLIRRDEPASLDVDLLWKAFKVFRQFDLLNRDQKRRLLNTITPRIMVANYRLEGMSLAVSGKATWTGIHRGG